MRSFITLSESLNGFIRILDIPDAAARRQCCLAFNKLARRQRGAPERMGGATFGNKNLHPNGTGLYTHATEHVGDLTNRMAADWATDDEGNGDFGYKYVAEKVNRALRYARNTYGFERDIREQIERNYHYTAEKRGETGNPEGLKAWWIDLEEAGLRYAKAHSALVVYNEAQWVAREAAIELGYMNFSAYVKLLERLEAHLDSAQEWADYASLVVVDERGEPKPFSK